MCQDVRRPIQKRDRGEVGFWAVGWVVYTIVERWAQSYRGSRKVGNEDIHDKFQEGLLEENSARW